MFWWILLLWMTCVEVGTLSKRVFEPFSDELIRYINEESGALWKADHTRKFRNIDEARCMLGALLEDPVERKLRRPTVVHDVKDDSLPLNFDSRTQWPHCSVIGQIRDQSSCGSCWAFGAVEAMSDRLCIHSGGSINVSLSARDLISCCTGCGGGCQGGWPNMAWDYWCKHGIVTGDSKEVGTGCQPYPFPKCSHHGWGNLSACPEDLYPTPECIKECTESYGKSYESDKYYGNISYNLEGGSPSIMKELLTRGPVEATFSVYEDFFSYKSGIYHHVAGHWLGFHAVRVLGWGEENGIPYWLVANSWNEQWGENGFFRMLKEKDECGIESSLVAGLPSLKQTDRNIVIN